MEGIIKGKNEQKANWSRHDTLRRTHDRSSMLLSG